MAQGEIIKLQEWATSAVEPSTQGKLKEEKRNQNMVTYLFMSD